MLGVLQAATLVAAGSCALTALVAAATYPAVRARLFGIDPARRARILVAWIAAPVGVGLGLAAVCFLPSVLSVLGVGPDHCLLHEDRHVHLCLIHRPPFEGGAVGWLTIAIAVTMALGVAYRLRQIVRSSRSVSSLLKVATHDREWNVHVVESDQPVSFAIGTLRPAICVSSKMLASLPEPVVGVVIEHERVHLRRPDPLRLQLAAMLSIAHARGVRRRMLGDLALACEQACDEAAAGRSRDRVGVARAILAVERLFTAPRGRMNLAFSSFGGSDIAARVEWLLADSVGARRARLCVWLTGCLALGVLLNVYHLHHLTETLLGLLLK